MEPEEQNCSTTRSTQKQNISTNGVGVELVQFNSAAYGGSGYLEESRGIVHR